MAWLGLLSALNMTVTVSADTAFLETGELRASFLRFTVDARRANWTVIDLLYRVGRPKGATPGQVAQAWLIAQKPFIVPIPGKTKVAHLDENLGALSLRLDENDTRIFFHCTHRRQTRASSA